MTKPRDPAKVRAWKENNRERHREYRRRYREKHREKYNAKCARIHRRSCRRWRLMIVEFLGGKCADCGFSDHRAFEFHHPNNDGKEHRKSSGNTVPYYRSLWKMAVDCPGSIILLCANCHRIRHWKEVEV